MSTITFDERGHITRILPQAPAELLPLWEIAFVAAPLLQHAPAQSSTTIWERVGLRRVTGSTPTPRVDPEEAP
jgi:hypothetical protein